MSGPIEYPNDPTDRLSMRLPMELLQQVLTDLPPPQLSIAIRSSPILMELGLCILYRQISNEKYSLERTRCLLHTLSRRTHLAVLVRTICFRLPGGFGKVFTDWDLLDAALRGTTQVESLWLSLPRYSEKLLHQIVFPRLQVLHFMALSEASDIPFTNEFLSRHPTIHSLSITGDNPSLFEDFSITALPKLSTLRVTSPAHLTRLTPGRPLRRVRISLMHQARAVVPTDLAACLSHLGRVSGPGLEEIRLDLRAGLGFNVEIVLDVLAELPAASLRLEFARNGSPSINQLTTFVSSSQHLRNLVVSQFPNYTNEEQQDLLVLDWFILCPELESVSFVDRDVFHRVFMRVSLGKGSENGHEGPVVVRVTWRTFDESRTLTRGPDGLVDWKLVGWMWESIKRKA